MSIDLQGFSASAVEAERAPEQWTYLVPGVLSDARVPAEETRKWPHLDLSNDGAETVVGLPDRLRRLATMTALSWENVAMALGVSRRSVHLWLAGGHVSPRNKARIEALERLILNERRPREEPQVFKARLTDSGTGESLLSSWRRRVLADDAGRRGLGVMSRLDRDDTAGVQVESSSKLAVEYGVVDL